MPTGVGGGVLGNPAVKPADGVLWSFVNGAWQARTPAQVLAAAPLTLVDALTTFADDIDPTKQGQFQLSGLTTGTNRTWTMPDANTTLAGLSVAQTWSAAQTFSVPIASTSGGTGVNNAGTFTNPANSSITGGGTLALGGFTLTVPATDTAALLGQTQTFTGAKTFTAPTTFNGTASGTSNITAAPTINNPAATYIHVFHPVVTGTVPTTVGNSFWLTTNNDIVAAGNTLIGVEFTGRFGANGGAGGGSASSGYGVNGGAQNTGLTLTTLAGAAFNAQNNSGSVTTAVAMSLSVSNGGTLGTGIGLQITGNAGTTKQAIQIANGCGPIVQNDTTASTNSITGAVQVGDGTAAGTVGIGGGVVSAGTSFKVNATKVIGAQITGYGTPTGGANQGSFAASTITLANLAAGVAQLILDLKTHGLLGT